MRKIECLPRRQVQSARRQRSHLFLKASIILSQPLSSAGSDPQSATNTTALPMFCEACLCALKNALDRARFRGESGASFGNHGWPANAESIRAHARSHRPTSWIVMSAAARLTRSMHSARPCSARLIFRRVAASALLSALEDNAMDGATSILLRISSRRGLALS